jgi:choline dehydrogenase-like flavoprotein
VIGSGFGGSVAVLRATEKGYRVGVMESGKRWNDEDLPHTSWDMRKFLWQPELEMFGIQRMEYLEDVFVLCGAGVGGGSHVYANTLYTPPKRFFEAKEWSAITDWADELAAYIDLAKRMLGVVRFPYMDTPVFVAQQFLVQQQYLYAQAQGDIALGLITVYRALGGGWELRLADQAAHAEAVPAAEKPAAAILPPRRALPPAR